MNQLDLLVLAGIGTAALWPLLKGVVARVRSPRPAAPVTPTSSVQEWRQAWASTLIRLIDELEGGDGHFPNPDAALRLSKELLWEVIGGDGPQPSKSK